MAVATGRKPWKIRAITALFVLLSCCLVGTSAVAPVFADKLPRPLPKEDVKNLDEFPNWAASTGGGSCSSSTTTVPAGTLPSFIPEPYNGAFTQGATKHNVAPALVAAIFSEEHNLGNSETDPNTAALPNVWKNFPQQHPDPNGGWGSSTAGAQGPFQFEPATWTGLGYDLSDINNLVVAADAAGKYLASNGGTKDKPDDGLKGAIFRYNHADWYVTAVLKYYDYYNTASSNPTGGGNGDTTTTPAPATDTTDTSTCGGGSDISPDCTNAVGNTKILCAAKAYEGIYYTYGGGPHGSGAFAGFESSCSPSVLANAASKSSLSDPGPCTTDCSGLVTVAVDSAFGKDLGWTVGTLVGDSANWQSIPDKSNVQSGDVVVVNTTSDQHVEIVDHYSKGVLHTFGSHHTGTQTGPTTSSLSNWTGAYRYIGPGSQ